MAADLDERFGARTQEITQASCAEIEAAARKYSRHVVLEERARLSTGKPVLLDLSLFRIRGFRYGSIAALIVGLGEFGLLFALPLPRSSLA